VLEALARGGEVSGAHLREPGVSEVGRLRRSQRGRALERADRLLHVVRHQQRDTELVQRVRMLRP